MRDKPEWIAEGGRKITLIGQQTNTAETEETWLIFSRDVAKDHGPVIGQVEVAFSLDPQNVITRVSNTPLVVYFPTVVPTNLGFLVQGPYKTTPSRDNVLVNDPWNQHLVRETCSLLVESLLALRDRGYLTVNALQVLPLDRTNFSEGKLFSPMFEAVRMALRTESLLPTVDKRE